MRAKICAKRSLSQGAFLSGSLVPRAWSVNTPEISADINPGKRHPYFPPAASSVQSLNLWRHRLQSTAWNLNAPNPATDDALFTSPHVPTRRYRVVTFSEAMFLRSIGLNFQPFYSVFSLVRINNRHDERYDVGRLKCGGDRRAVNMAVTGSSDIWAAKWLGAAVTSRSAAAPHPQKDKKDSEIRFTSGLPEMGRKLQRAALCRAIYLAYRYPISALWHVISPWDPFNFYSRALFNHCMVINFRL